MLQFLRRHQRYFFALITTVIVISFSFFGTYNTFVDQSAREQIAFTDVTGRPVTRHELDTLVQFLGTDAEDKLLFGGVWGPNFLNDGVIKRDFIETGLLQELALAYPQEVKEDLQPRFEKEKHFQLYKHPSAAFISTENAWKYFFPEMNTAYSALKSSTDPLSKQALEARAALFLGERKLPPQALAQILRYQERQANWPQPDQSLAYADLSLFGYHTAEDWFGPRLLRIAAEFILNAAAVAEERGYGVTKAESLAELRMNADTSFKQLAASGLTSEVGSGDYLNEQLRRMGLDANDAAKIWRNVLLFRRLFQDMGQSVFVDANSFAPFVAYAGASLQGDLYRLPDALRLKDFSLLQQFEVYLDAISKRGKDPLALPEQFFTVEEVKKNTPELVQKRYEVEMRSVDKKQIMAEIGLKETWNWEVEDANWESLKKRFPELALKPAKTREERFTSLDSLDEQTRSRIDNMARGNLVDQNPELLQKALAAAPLSEQVLTLKFKGPNTTIKGLNDAAPLMELLDKAALNAEPEGLLREYSADGKTYYSIKVKARSQGPEISTFAEAQKDQALQGLVQKKLEGVYAALREKNPAPYKKEDQSWKPLADVQTLVAAEHYAPLLTAIKKDYASTIAPLKVPEGMTNDQLASLRLFAYGRQVKEALQKQPESAGHYVDSTPPLQAKPSVSVSRPELTAQWRFLLIPFTLQRSSSSELTDKMEAFAIQEGQWTKVHTPPNGDLSFFHLVKRDVVDSSEDGLAPVKFAKERLSQDAKQQLGSQLLKEIQERNAISLRYLDSGSQEMETPISEGA